MVIYPLAQFNNPKVKAKCKIVIKQETFQEGYTMLENIISHCLNCLIFNINLEHVSTSQ